MFTTTMADFDDDRPPAPPVRNDSTRNYTSFYSTNSSSLSGSMSTTSSNTTNTTSSSLVSNSSSPGQFDKPLPKTPDEDENKKKSRVKQTKVSISQSLQALSNSLFPRKLNISMPINFYHEIHITFNPITGEFEVFLLCVILILMLER